MRLKDATVQLEGMDWHLWHAAVVVEEVLKEYGAELVITSAHDGKHHDGSLHYVGRAIDVRTWAISGREGEVVAKIKARLGAGYDVVIEADHIHIEWDPK